MAGYTGCGSESNRYGHFHNLMKLRHWMREDAEIAELYAAGMTYWILFSYFRARGLHYPGIDKGVAYARQHTPGLVEKLAESLRPGSDRLTLLEEASEIALEPVGGVWRGDDVLTRGWDGSPSPEQVEEAKRLLGSVLGSSKP